MEYNRIYLLAKIERTLQMKSADLQNEICLEHSIHDMFHDPY